MIDDLAEAALDIILFRWLYSSDSGIPRWLAILIMLMIVAALAAAIWYFFLR